jgi:hypothetical protein
MAGRSRGSQPWESATAATCDPNRHPPTRPPTHRPTQQHAIVLEVHVVNQQQPRVGCHQEQGRNTHCLRPSPAAWKHCAGGRGGSVKPGLVSCGICLCRTHLCCCDRASITAAGAAGAAAAAAGAGYSGALPGGVPCGKQQQALGGNDAQALEEHGGGAVIL